MRPIVIYKYYEKNNLILFYFKENYSLRNIFSKRINKAMPGQQIYGSQKGVFFH